MAIIELDEGELRQLQAEHAASAPAKKIVDTIVAGKNRLPFLRMVKELSPGTAIPEIDALDAAKPEFAALQAEIDALKAANKAEKEAAEKASREANADGYARRAEAHFRRAGYDDEGIKALTAFMDKRGLSDFEAAEALFSKSQPAQEPVTPTGFGGGNWDFYVPQGEDDPLTQILKLPKAQADKAARSWSLREAKTVLADLRSGRLAA